ncbi:hypothetical protein BD311DRAFT_761704 [Dichomitus squalens]|uniref:Uncharacterized protein n=1 Tax=Dichomitus squalens TaxID=114155 RepID=A0A4V2JZY7_9APHY|nr:hypothetical protein BD311DRAFT_761704 [Dichomitus squalens]
MLHLRWWSSGPTYTLIVNISLSLVGLRASFRDYAIHHRLSSASELFRITYRTSCSHITGRHRSRPSWYRVALKSIVRLDLSHIRCPCTPPLREPAPITDL